MAQRARECVWPAAADAAALAAAPRLLLHLIEHRVHETADVRRALQREREHEALPDGQVAADLGVEHGVPAALGH